MESKRVFAATRLLFFVTLLYGSICQTGLHARQDGGLILGNSRFLTVKADGKRTVRELDFMLACDQDCCLTGSCVNLPDDPGFKPFESFGLANKGNQFTILIFLKRTTGKALSLSGEWSVENFSEFRNHKLEDSFQSRFRAVEFGSEGNFALPIFLSGHIAGVSQEVFLSALRGTNFSGSNELGSLEILGSQGIGRIVFKKDSSNLLFPGGSPISKFSVPSVPNGYTSIAEDYSFTPERRQNVREPFRCLGTKTETLPNGRSNKTEIEINVTEQGDATAARKFINAFLEKLPTNKLIVTDSGIDVATVLVKGKQKVVADREVEGISEPRFNNKSPSFYYYAIVLFFLVILGMIGYYRWARNAS